jgi:hypothetical protein
MKQFDWRIVIGAALIVLGCLMLLERLGFFRGAIGVFWGAAFLVGAGYFLYRFAADSRGDWWAAIPGFALAGLAVESLLPSGMWALHGLSILGLLGLGFFVVYLSGRERWWALIPGGVLITLAFISVLENTLGGGNTAGILFAGLGLTFLLVAILAGRQWAYIPGVVLLALGALLGAALTGAVGLLWPVVLVAAGLIMVLRFAIKR